MGFSIKQDKWVSCVECSCFNVNYLVTNVKLNNSTLEIFYFKHWFVEFEYICLICNNKGVYTAEFERSGYRIRPGRYTNSKTFKTTSVEMKIINCFKNILNYNNKYNIIFNNCKDWARRLYYDLIYSYLK